MVAVHNGLTVQVTSRDLDSVAPFVVSSNGNRVDLTLNAAHALWRGRNLPFAGGDSSEAFELLLTAWALQEVSLPSANAQEQMADVRFMLGKCLQDVLRGS